MNFPIPEIVDIDTLAQAEAAGCDCVMLKFDGWPVLINCIGTEGHVLSHMRHEQRKSIEHLEVLDNIVVIEPLTALFVGAKVQTNPVIYLYDTWWMDGQDVKHLTYRERYVLTRMNVKKLDERFQMVTVLPVQAAKTLWMDVITDPVHYKGLVFRHSKDAAGAKVYVIRHYAESPRELV